MYCTSCWNRKHALFQWNPMSLISWGAEGVAHVSIQLQGTGPHESLQVLVAILRRVKCIQSFDTNRKTPICTTIVWNYVRICARHFPCGFPLAMLSTWRKKKRIWVWIYLNPININLMDRIPRNNEQSSCQQSPWGDRKLMAVARWPSTKCTEIHRNKIDGQRRRWNLWV